jgi:hypothetical protein
VARHLAGRPAITHTLSTLPSHRSAPRTPRSPVISDDHEQQPSSGLRAAVVRHRWAAGLIVLSVALGLAFALVAPPGAAYDEPSHFATVQYYSEHHRLPELSEPGVTYEAQQPPLYYALSAVVYGTVEPLLGSHEAFYAVRIATMLLVIPIALLSYAIAVGLTEDRRLAAWASAVVALGAPLLTLTSSVQNDSLMIMLSMLGIVTFIRSERRQSLRWALAAGLVFGLAILSKTPGAAVLAGTLLAVVVRRDGRWVVRGLAMAAAAVVVSGWWFVRNQILYSDPTAHTAITLAGYPLPVPATLSLRAIGRLAGSAVATYSVPAEYYRNVFHPIAPLRLAAVALAFTTGVGILLAIRRRQPRIRQPELLAGLCVVGTAMAAYLVEYFATDSIPLRLTYVLIAYVAVAATIGLRAVHQRMLPAAVVLLVVIDLSFLRELAAEPMRVFHLW